MLPLSEALYFDANDDADRNLLARDGVLDSTMRGRVYFKVSDDPPRIMYVRNTTDGANVDREILIPVSTLEQRDCTMTIRSTRHRALTAR